MRPKALDLWSAVKQALYAHEDAVRSDDPHAPHSTRHKLLEAIEAYARERETQGA